MVCSAVFFSPTGGSKKGVLAVAERLCGGDIVQYDITEYRSRGIGGSFGKNDIVVFGAPVYGGRIPCIAAERFRNFKGDGTPCVVTVTYGNRDYDDALAELCEIARENGFAVQAAAALVGQHTFGEIQVGRPDDGDIGQDREFADAVKKRVEEDGRGKEAKLGFKGEPPYKEGGKGAGFIPQTKENCIKCKKCVEGCPAGAIADDCFTIDGQACLSCFRCIHVCPKGAKVMETPEYITFAEGFSKKLAARRENEYFLPAQDR